MGNTTNSSKTRILKKKRLVLVPTDKTIQETIDDLLSDLKLTIAELNAELEHRERLKSFMGRYKYDYSEEFRNIRFKNLETIALEGYLNWCEMIQDSAVHLKKTAADPADICAVLELQHNYMGLSSGSSTTPFPNVKESKWKNLDPTYIDGQEATRDILFYTFQQISLAHLAGAIKRRVKARNRRIAKIVAIVVAASTVITGIVYAAL